MSTVDPRLTDTFIEWSDYMNPTLEEFGTVGRLLVEGDWKNWAAGVISLPGISALGPPSPYQFTDWKDWAFRFNDVLNQGY